MEGAGPLASPVSTPVSARYICSGLGSFSLTKLQAEIPITLVPKLKQFLIFRTIASGALLATCMGVNSPRFYIGYESIEK